MKLHISSSLTSIYRLHLNAYPPEYRTRFGDEMYDTFSEGVEGAESLGTLPFFLLHEIRDIPGMLIKAHWEEWMAKLETGVHILQDIASTSDLPPAPPDGRDSWREVIFETSLFLATGLLLILVTYFPFEGLLPGWQRNEQFLGNIVLPITVPVLLYGVMRGLPRWAYPFAGLLLCYAAFVAGQTGFWLFLTLMLLASSVLFLAAILTDPQPSRLPISIRRIGQSFSLDWTRLSFAVYGAMPLVVLMAFDDSHFDNRTPFLALCILAMIMSAFLYCRSRTESMQLLALFGGITFSLGCAWLDRISLTNSMSSWIIVSSPADMGTLWLFILWAQWSILLLSPGILLTLGRNLGRKSGSQIRHGS